MNAKRFVFVGGALLASLLLVVALIAAIGPSRNGASLSLAPGSSSSLAAAAPQEITTAPAPVSLVKPALPAVPAALRADAGSSTQLAEKSAGQLQPVIPLGLVTHPLSQQAETSAESSPGSKPAAPSTGDLPEESLSPLRAAPPAAGRGRLPDMAYLPNGNAPWGQPQAGALDAPLPAGVNLAVCLDTQRVWGLVGAGETVTVTVNGAQMGAALADANGFFWTTLYNSGGDRPNLAAGDALEIYHDGVLAASLTLQDIQAEIDAQTEMVSGVLGGVTSPANVTLYAPVLEPSPTAYSMVAATDASGNFSANMSSAWNFSIWDVGAAAYTSGGVEVHRHMFPQPGIMARPSPWNWVFGTAAPGERITATLYLADLTTIKASGSANADGYHFFLIQLGAEMNPTDVVEVEYASGGTLSLEVEPLSMVMDAAANTISGYAPPGSAVRGVLDSGLTPDGYKSFQVSGAADSSGAYSLDFNGLANLLPNTTASVFLEDADGDELNVRSFSPGIVANYTLDEVYGHADAPPGPAGAGIQVTVDVNTSGTLQTASRLTDNYGAFFFNLGEYGIDLLPNSLVTVKLDGSPWEASVQMQGLAAAFDIVSDQITGTYTPPSDSLDLEGQQWAVFGDSAGYYPVGGYFATLTTGSSGAFNGTTSGFDLRDGSSVNVMHRKADENAENFRTDTDSVRIWPQYSTVVAQIIPNNTAFTLTLRTSLGDLKAEISGISNHPLNGPNYTNFGETGQQIEPGDSLQARSAAGYDQTYIIPDMNVFIDGDLDNISGGAPANSLVYLELANQGSGFAPTSTSGEFTVNADQLQGVYGSGDVQWGDWGRVCYLYSTGSQVCANYDWPQISAWYDMQGHSQVFGFGAIPGNTIRITVTHPVAGEIAVVETTGGACDGCGPYDYSVFLDPGTIEPGNTVEVDFGDGYKDSIVVAALTASADVNSDLLTGTAPADTLLYLHVDDGRGSGMDVNEIPVDGSGNFSVDLAGYGWDIQPGDNFNFSFPMPSGHTTNYFYWLPAPNLWIEKWNTPGNAEPGGTFLYQLRYHNDGNGSSANTTLVDVLPPGVSYYAHTGGFPVVVSGDRLTFTLGTLPAGVWGDLFLAVSIDPGLTPGSQLANNCVTIQTTTVGDFDSGNDTACTSGAQVDFGDSGLWLRKYPQPSDPTPGEQYDYIIEYGSNGSSASAPVWLTDTLPAGTSLVSWMDEWGWSGLWELYSSSGGQLVFRAPAGIPGNMGGRLRLTVALDPAVQTLTALQNYAAAVTANDDYPWDNNSSEWHRTRLPRYDLRMDNLESAGSLVPGGYVDYWMNIYNNGNSPSGARITVTLAAGLSYQPGSTWVNDESGGYNLEPVSIAGSEISWGYPALGVNRSFNLSFRTDIDPALASGTALDTCGVVGLEQADGNLSDNSRCSSWIVNALGPNLYIAKSMPRGDNDTWRLYYELRFYNLGSQAVQNVWITDTLPAGASYGGWWNMNFDWGRLISNTQSSSVLRWQLSELNPGDSGSFQFEAAVDDPNDRPRSYTNTAVISTPPGDVEPAGNTAELTAYRGEVYNLQMYVGEDWMNIWGSASPGSSVLVETASGDYTSFADPGCNGCWGINEPGSIQPGDRITVTAGAGIDPLVLVVPAPFYGAADPASDTISGQVGAAAGEKLNVSTRNYFGWDTYTAAGGLFQLSLPELPENARGEIYYSPVIDHVQVTFIRRYYATLPHIAANFSHEWVQGQYEAGHTAWITVTQSDGVTPKAIASVPIGPISWWGGEPGFEPQSGDWFPTQPDIQPGDYVYVRIDDGADSVLHIGEIQGAVSAAGDRIDGTALAPWISHPVMVFCHTWGSGGGAPQKYDVITLDSVDPYACAWNPAWEWDIQPNQDVGVEYVEPGDNSVFAAFYEPSPNLAINHNPNGNPGEGGNLMLRVNYVNQGGLTAPGTVITQTLQGMNYLYDTSGLTAISGTTPGGDPYVAWQLGDLPPGNWTFFDVFVEVALPAGSELRSTVQIATSAAYDAGDPGDKTNTWVGQVAANDTWINISKNPWTGDPIAGQDFIWQVQPCVNGNTSSSELTLTDQLPEFMTFNGWWASTPGWVEQYQDADTLILTNGSVPNGWCPQIYLHFVLDADINNGTSISNTATVAASNDLGAGDDTVTSWITVGRPHLNVYLNKDLSHGQLTPGGVFAYNLNFGNNGNLDAYNLTITDTLPANTSLRSIRRYDNNWNDLGLVNNYTLAGGKVSWPVGTLENGYWGTYQVELALDPGAQPGDPLDNSAEITRLPGEDNLADNQDSWNEVVQPHGPNLRVTKWHYWEGASGYNYQIQFNNIGDQSVQNVWISDTLPANTVWDNWWSMGFDWSRLTTNDFTPNQLRWQFSELYPGDSGWLQFNVRLDGPDTRPMGYTNTVTITTDPADTNPQDNRSQDVDWRAGVDTVEVWVADEYGYLWGTAPAGTNIDVTTPRSAGSAFADPSCGGCWNTGMLGAILPGDRITVTTSFGGDPLILTVPDPFYAQADAGSKTISGRSGTTSSLVNLGIYGYPEHQVQSDASGYFSDTFLDVPTNGSGEMRYIVEQDGTTIYYHRRFYTQYPQFSVNYSHEWVNGHWQAGQTVWITVTQSDGTTEKAHAQLTTHFVGNWGGDQGWEDNGVDFQWLPARPDFQVGDWVHVRTSAGDLTSLQIGEIQGTVEAAQDRIQGVVNAAWISESVPFNCHTWGAPGGTPGKSGWVTPDGVDTYSCAWDPATEWDILPMQEVGVEYYEPGGNTVLAAFHEPAPYLRISKWSDSNLGEGGGMQFTIEYRNDGDVLALAPVITDTLEGMLFVRDQGAGYLNRTVTALPGEPITVRYEMSDLAPGEVRRFFVYAEVAVAPLQTVTNTAQITTASPYDAGDPSEKISTWSRTVYGNDTQLNISKSPWTGDPLPGDNFTWQTVVCNNGSTSSDLVTLVDTLPVSATLISYDPQDPGWQLVSQVGRVVTLDHGSLRNNSCTSIFWHMLLDASVQPGASISNTVTIQADSDLTTGDDAATSWVTAGNPHFNPNVNKWWGGGSLVPGGEIRYHMAYNNSGNQTVNGIVLTDTLPVSTTLVHLYRYDYLWRYQGEVTPTWVDSRTIRWDVGTVLPGYQGYYEVALRIDPAALPGTELVNTLNITPLPGEDNPNDNQASVTELVFPHGPNLRLRRGGGWDDWGVNTRRASLWMNLDNVGDQRAENIVLRDEYPPEMSLDGFDAEWWRTGMETNFVTHVFTATVAYLEGGESTWVNHGILLPGSGPAPFGLVFTDTATIMPVPGETSLADNSTVIVLTTGPDLYVQKSLESGILQPGEILTFRLDVGNNRFGHEWWWSTTSDVWVTDILPAGLEFVEALRQNCGWCPIAPDSANGQEYGFNLGPFSSGYQDALLISVLVSGSVGDGALLTNTAVINSFDPGVDIEPYYDNNTSTLELSFSLPALQIGKLYESTRLAGEVVTYTLSVTNTGSVAATGVVVSDTLPAGLTYGAGGGGSGATFNDTAVTWTVADIQPGAHATLWFSATLPSGGTVANDAYRVVASDQGVATPNGAPVSFEVISSATLNFQTGWNLITLPLQPQTVFNAETLLQSINSQGGICDAAYRWLDGDWEAHNLGSIFRRFEIEMGGGYFIRCSTPSSWTINGTQLTASVNLNLSTGWNGIGVPFPPNTYNAETLLLDVNNQGGACDAVYEWLDGEWNAHSLGSIFRRFTIEPDKGYFLRCTAPSGYTPTAFSTPIYARRPLLPLNVGLSVTMLFISGVLVFYRRRIEPAEVSK